MAERRDDWGTPSWLFDRMQAEFEFTVDAAALEANRKCERFFSPGIDGLAQDWTAERVWCNPPYGKGIHRWVHKALMGGAEVAVMLLPVRTESAWWNHLVVPDAAEIRFIRGRVHFTPPSGVDLPPGGSRPVFASAIVVFGPPPGPRLSSFPTPRIAEAERQLLLDLDDES